MKDARPHKAVGVLRAAMPDEADGMTCAMVKYLHEFLRDNWEEVHLGSEWKLYEADGEPVGFKYPCPGVGEIDLLATHRNTKRPRWLVLEVTRKQTSDHTVGRVLRYMGWVEEHLAKGDAIEGVIAANECDERLRCALKSARRCRP